MKLILLIFFMALSSFAVDTLDHRVYQHVIRLRPNINRNWAAKFAQLIATHSLDSGLDAHRAVAIAMQESSLREIHRTVTTMKTATVCDSAGCVVINRKKISYTDYGIFQFHVRTVENSGFDLQRLKDHDLEYAVKRYFDLMSEKLRMCRHLGDDAWTCYHSTTPALRNRYKKLVNRYYP
jgi:hypothetical protein